jgi:ankyrin repeat protein
LMLASEYGQIEVVKLLLENGANVDLQVKGLGETALYRASKNGNTEIVKLLIDKGAKIDLQDEDGLTALIIALERGYKETAILLINEGANLDVRDKEGWTPLMKASLDGDTEMVSLLINKGAKMNLQHYNDGLTALMLASGRWNTVRHLRATYKDGYETVDAKETYDGEHVDIVKLLLEEGAEPATLDYKNKTAYDYAKNEEIRTLLETYINKK